MGEVAVGTCGGRAPVAFFPELRPPFPSTSSSLPLFPLSTPSPAGRRDGDGWWVAPLAPASTKSSAPPRAMIGFGYGLIDVVAAERAPAGSPFPSSSSAGSSFSASSRGFEFRPASLVPPPRPEVGMKRGANAYATEDGVAWEIVDAELGFGGEAHYSSRKWQPLQHQQKAPSLSRNGKSIAERRAESCGFSAPRISTAKFRCSGSPICSPAAVCSPYLTIPPGLSPAALLDSPVMLSNTQVSLDISTENFGMGYIHSQSLAEASLQNNYENQMSFLGVPPKDGSSDSQSDAKVSDDAVGKGKDNAVQSCNPGIVNDVSQHLQDAEQSGAFSLGAGRLPDDGFNWRKYGQKQVKGSEYPRSYYKCTHPNCQVKKKVERSYAGQITEIIYKGKHNHPKPNPICRSIIGSSVPLTDMSETLEDHRSSIKTESDSVWSNLCGSEEDRSTGCQPDGLERMSSTSAQTDVSDLMHPTVEKHLGELETTESMVPLSALTCHDSYDQITHDTMPLEWHDKDDKSDSKIRMNVSYLMETSSATRSSREPRVLVQTESEVDILDDGYHWRKYGQKVVKGNPNPRSYYKCTNPGCSVRKHVERAAHDLKSVITTYEGKHNHDVPVSRKSSHSSSSSGSFPSVANAQPSAVPGSSNNPEHTTGVRHLTSHFKRKLISHEYIMHSHPVGSLTDGKFEPAHRYERKLLQRLAPRHPGLGFKRTDVPPASAMANLSHELQESCQRVLTTGMVCVNMDHGAAASSASLTWLLLAQRLESMDQQATEQEQKDGAFCGTGLPTSELAHVLSPPAIGGRIMGVYQPR